LSTALTSTAARARRVGEVRPAIALAPLVAAHWAVVAAIGLTAERDGWRFAGDAPEWAAARALGHLDVGAVPAYGTPVLLWPFALGDALPVAVVLQVLIGGPLVVLAVYGICARIAGRLLGYAAAFAWVVAPLLTLGFFYSGERSFQGIPYDDFRGLVHDTVLPSALGLVAGPGYPSLVAIVVAASLVVRSLDTARSNDILLAGLVAGFAVGVRPLNAVFLPAPLLGLVAARRWRSALAFAAALAPALMTLALWRWAAPVDAFGGFEFRRYDFWANRVHLRGAGWSYLLVLWIAIAGCFAVVRRAPAKGLLVAAWFAGFFVVASGSLARGRVLDGSLFRLIEPGYPALALLAAALILLVPPLGRRGPASVPGRERVRVTRGIVVGAVALGAYPLVIVVLAALT
jgi:hypothetical protein